MRSGLRDKLGQYLRLSSGLAVILRKIFWSLAFSAVLASSFQDLPPGESVNVSRLSLEFSISCMYCKVFVVVPLSV